LDICDFSLCVLLFIPGHARLAKKVDS